MFFLDASMTKCPHLQGLGAGCFWCLSIQMSSMQELIAKSIESSDLNFNRYGDTFFEVSF